MSTTHKQMFIEDYLSVSEKACLYASVLAYGVDSSYRKLPGMFDRRSFYLDGVPYKYVKELSTDFMAVFIKTSSSKAEIIVAFRGTQGDHPERFLGVPARVALTYDQMSLSDDEREKVLAKGCPALAAVGCNSSTANWRLFTTNNNTNVPSQQKVGKELRGGDVFGAISGATYRGAAALANTTYNGAAATAKFVFPTLNIPVVLERSSDCLADYEIVTQNEDNSKLHRMAALALYNLLQGTQKHTKTITVMVTGHSLGGSLAAFAAWQAAERGFKDVKVRLFTPGSGAGKVAGSITWTNGCKTTNVLELQTQVEEVMRAEQSLGSSALDLPFPVKPFPHASMKRWEGLDVVMIREHSDVVSFPAWTPFTWYPTRSFVTGYKSTLPNATMHGLFNYMPDATFVALTTHKARNGQVLTRKFDSEKDLRSREWYISEKVRQVTNVNEVMQNPPSSRGSKRSRRS